MVFDQTHPQKPGLLQLVFTFQCKDAHPKANNMDRLEDKQKWKTTTGRKN